MMESTPQNSDNESEDDLPATSMTQTPIKLYPSLDTIEDGEIVWVKYKRDPHWPALVVKGGNKNKVVVKFFNHDDYDFPVKDKKNILPFLCADKEKFELEQSKDDQLKAALRDAYLLLRSRGSEEFSGTPVEQYEAVKKRRSQTTPCKRITFTETSSCFSDDDEPAMSAFGYDITSKHDCGPAPNNDTAATQEVEDIVASVFPDGSLYSYDILKHHFTLLESELYDIFKGSTPSENHRVFLEGTFKERDRLKIQNRCGPLEYLHIEHWKELQDLMIGWVTKWSKAENKEVVEMRYVSDVLFPEATVRTMMKIENITIKEAWVKFIEL